MTELLTNLNTGIDVMIEEVIWQDLRKTRKYFTHIQIKTSYGRNDSFETMGEIYQTKLKIDFDLNGVKGGILQQS